MKKKEGLPPNLRKPQRWAAFVVRHSVSPCERLEYMLRFRRQYRRTLKASSVRAAHQYARREALRWGRWVVALVAIRVFSSLWFWRLLP